MNDYHAQGGDTLEWLAADVLAVPWWMVL